MVRRSDDVYYKIVGNVGEMERGWRGAVIADRQAGRSAGRQADRCEVILRHPEEKQVRTHKMQTH